MQSQPTSIIISTLCFRPLDLVLSKVLRGGVREQGETILAVTTTREFFVMITIVSCFCCELVVVVVLAWPVGIFWHFPSVLYGIDKED